MMPQSEEHGKIFREEIPLFNSVPVIHAMSPIGISSLSPHQLCLARKFQPRTTRILVRD